MPVYWLSDKLIFPPVSGAEEGIVAAGGDLSPERLLLAYRSGIFPWYSAGEPILWWSPDPRFVLFPEELNVSTSMERLIRRKAFRVTYDTAFPDVIDACACVPRAGQDDTWILPEMRDAYVRLHELGFAHSAEVWQGDNLVGGVYGVLLGKVFFGESMFHTVSNASKYGFISWARRMAEDGVRLIDCQVYTRHLESLGARYIPRTEFLEQLRKLSD